MLPLIREQRSLRACLCSPDTPTRGLRPVVVFCHGIPGSRPAPEDAPNTYGDLCAHVCAQGFNGVFLNFSGCGASEGDIDMDAWYEDLSFLLFRLLNTPGIDPQGIHLVASSAGGAVAAKVLSMNKDIRSLLLLAAPADLGEIIPPDPALLAAHFRGLGLIRDPAFPSDPDTWHRGFTALKPEHWLPFLAPRPVGIIHGDADETVPLEHAHRLQRAGGTELTILPGGGHRLREDPRLPGLLTAWLDKVKNA